MKALLLAYWRRLRFSEADRQRAMRGECINVAARFETKQPGDFLRNAKLVYEWWEHGQVPSSDASRSHDGPTLQ